MLVLPGSTVFWEKTELKLVRLALTQIRKFSKIEQGAQLVLLENIVMRWLCLNQKIVQLLTFVTQILFNPTSVQKEDIEAVKRLSPSYSV